jgi:amino acid adenylation domain-containing protein
MSFNNVLERLSAIMAESPDRTALVFQGRSWTFADLDYASARISGALAARAVGPESTVGLCLERSLEAAAVIVGVLRSGAAFVPIDPFSPPARVEKILDLARVRVCLTDMRGAAACASANEVITIDRDWDVLIGAEPGPIVPIRPQGLAYVIFTSGSTGEPKGVAMPHDGITTRVKRTLHLHPLTPEDCVLQLGSLAFDISVWELFVPLCAGARVVIAEQARSADFRYLVDLMDSEGVTLARFVPPVLQLLLDEVGLERCTRLRRIVTGGDVMSLSLMRRLAESTVEVYNQYGPTERPSSISWRCLVVEGLPSVPIGRPHQGTHPYVLDRTGNLAPLGAVGELFLGGDGLARGYLNRPAATADRFVPDPFTTEPGARMYRTGDLARWRADGDLEFIGRVDFQLQIGGVRVEAREVEMHMMSHPHVDLAVVTTHDASPTQRVLVGYFVARTPVDELALRAHLARRLPPAMVPAHLVSLESMPLNRNWKIDRLALPPPPAAVTEGLTLPQNDLEYAIAAVWRAHLNLPELGIHQNFFALGGHSLQAIRIVCSLQEEMGLNLVAADMFAAPTVASLAARAGQREVPDNISSGGEEVLLGERRLWVIQTLNPATTAYNMGRAFRLGSLDRPRLVGAVSALIKQHPPLRSVFATVAGEPLRKLLSVDEVGLELRDLSGLDDSAAERIARDILDTPFDLANGPLFRASLLCLDPDRHVLVLAAHHILMDGMSMSHVLHDLGVLYRQCALPNVAYGYEHRRRWERTYVDRDLARDLHWWIVQLRGAHYGQSLPLARSEHSSVARILRSWNRDQKAWIRSLAEDHDTSVFAVVLAAVFVLRQALTGEVDQVIGTISSGRDRAAWRSLVGNFVNTLALRVAVDDEKTGRDLIHEVRDRVAEALVHQGCPFDRVVEGLGCCWERTRNPLFDFLVVFDDRERFSLELGTACQPLPLEPAGMPFEVTIELEPLEEALSVRLGTSHLGASALERLWVLLDQVMMRLCRYPGDLVRKLGEFGSPRLASPVSSGNPLLAQVERQVTAFPQKICVADEDGALTYRETWDQARAVARLLVDCGIEPEECVAVLLDRSSLLVVGVLGVTAAGAAYVPLDPGWPDARIRALLHQCGARLVLTDKTGQQRDLGVPTIDLAATVSGPPLERAHQVQPEQIAYVVFTSGSTGTPRGVAVSHRALINLVRWHVRAFDVDADSLALLYASPGFDASVWELWPYVTAGATLRPVRGDLRLDLPALARLISVDGITHAFLPTRVCQLLAESNPGLVGVRVLTGGEALPSLAPRRFQIVNNYGPTEAGVVATSIDLGTEAWAVPPPIGMGIDGVDILVVGPGGRPCPAGVVGELWLSGEGLARGYIRDPRSTAEAFRPHPWRHSQRAYATGDLVHYDDDGVLYFHGRADDQVQLGGVRVEPAEVTQALCALKGIEAAAVVPLPSPAVGLLAGVVGNVDPMVVRDQLASLLPAAAVPRTVVCVDELPHTTAGKVDRQALVALANAEERPALPLEGWRVRVVAEVWRDVLGGPHPAATDSFESLGGTSLAALRVVAGLRDRLGVDLSPSEIYNHPDLASFARAVGKMAIDTPGMLNLASGDGPLLACMPSLFGYAGAYQALVSGIKDWRVVGFDTPPRANLADELTRVLERETGPGGLVLLGYSAGGNLGFSVAQHLVRAGLMVRAVVLLDSAWRDTARILDFATLKARVDTILESVCEPLTDPLASHLHGFLASWYADVDRGTIPFPLHVVRAEDTDIERALQWAGATTAEFRIHAGSGRHLEMLFGSHAARNAEVLTDLLHSLKCG